MVPDAAVGDGAGGQIRCIAMARALTVVGAALALLVGGLALAVYITRDEDNIQVDNLLSEDFTREVASASANGSRPAARRGAQATTSQAMASAASHDPS